MSAFLHQAWYAAAAGASVGRRPLARTLLDQALVLWRTEAGAPVAMRDRCPHRFAPLSQGCLHGDTIACPYHGMRFAPAGACVKVPGQDTIPPGARVQAYPVLERYGLVFVWMGNPDRADPSALVDVPEYGAPGWGLSRGETVFEANWQLVTDNLIDPAHTSFVHAGTIGSSAGEAVPLAARELPGGVIECGRWIDDAPAVPIVQRFARPTGHVDRWQYYYLKAPSTSWVDFGALPTGRPHTPEEQARAPYRVFSYAFLTPETAGRTRYHSFQLRNFAVDDEAVTAEFNAMYHRTFEEDRVLLEAIQREEAAHPGLPPVRIASDTGLVRLRRLQARLRDAETSAPAR